MLLLYYFIAIFYLVGLPLGAQFINNSPRVDGNVVEAEFRTSGQVASVFCTLSGGVRQECKLVPTEALLHTCCLCIISPIEGWIWVGSVGLFPPPPPPQITHFVI